MTKKKIPKRNKEEKVEHIETTPEEACYTALKMDLEGSLRQKGSCFDINSFKDDKGFFIEDLRGHPLESRILKISAYQKSPSAWTRIAKEMNKKIKEEKREEEINLEKDLEKELRFDILTKLAMKKPREATELIVKEILKNNRIYTTRNDIYEEVWIYIEGIYKPQGKTYIKEIIRNFLREAYTNQFYNEVLNKIEADTYVESEDFFSVKNIYEIPVQNGILNLKTREISEFSPDKIFFNKLPMEYNPKAICPAIDKHFREVLSTEEDVAVIEEIFGNVLIKDYRLEKAVMMLGAGRNGKGKTLELIKRFVGADNCSAVALKNMVEDGFFIKNMFGKLVNLSGDLSNTSLKETGCLRQLIGRDIIQANRKNQEMIDFINYATIIFACNELPVVYDSTDGFWTKWILLTFPYKFITQKEYNSLSEEEKENKKIIDPEHINKISTIEELSGLLNKALDGLDRTLKNDDYSYSVSSNEIKNFWIRKSDSFSAFCMDCIEIDYDNHISKKELRSKYSKYCKLFGKLKGMSDKSIKITLQNEYGCSENRKYFEESKILEWVWEGIKFKENIDEFFKKCKDNKGISSRIGKKNSDIEFKKGCFPYILDKNPEKTQKTPQNTLLEALKILQEQDNRLIPIDKIKEIGGFDNLDNLLNELKTQGLIFEPKPNFIQIID